MSPFPILPFHRLSISTHLKEELKHSLSKVILTLLRQQRLTLFSLWDWNAGEKVLLRWYRGYLISVVYGARGSSARAAAKSGAKDVMTVSVYDIQNQFVGES